MIFSYVLKNTLLKGKLTNLSMNFLILTNRALVTLRLRQNPKD